MAKWLHPIDKPKMCPVCQIVKQPEFFGIYYPKNWMHSARLQSQCASCRSLEGWRCRLWRDYALTIPAYNLIAKAQNGLCKICIGKYQRPTETLNVDHIENPFKIRGLLCMRCNLAAGNHSVEYLTQVTAYVVTEGFNMKGQSESNTSSS